MQAISSEPTSFGFRWHNEMVMRTKTKAGSLVALPEYYHLVKDGKSKVGKWVAVAAREVPAETGLAKVSFKRPAEKPLPPLVTPEDAERETLPQRVEKLHRHWTKDRNYLAPPPVGRLADLDQSLIGPAPARMEVGYVPIASRQH